MQDAINRAKEDQARGDVYASVKGELTQKCKWAKRALKKFNFHIIGWSIRSFDTVKNTKQTLKRIKKGLSTGDIITSFKTHGRSAVTKKEVPAGWTIK